MQSDNNQIYKLTAQRTGKAEQVYKDIGNYVFGEVYNNLRKPTKLIIKLKGVGKWTLRRKRMQAIIDLYPVEYGKSPEEFSSERVFFKNEDKKEIYDIFIQRLNDYEEYIKLRDEIRKERYKTQVLLQPTKGEDEG